MTFISSIKRMLAGSESGTNRHTELQGRLAALMAKHGAILEANGDIAEKSIHERLKNLVDKHKVHAAFIPAGAMLGASHLLQNGFSSDPDAFIAEYGGKSFNLAWDNGVFGFGNTSEAPENHDEAFSFEQSHIDIEFDDDRINPATGLSMVGMVDVAGNAYGSSG